LTVLTTNIVDIEYLCAEVADMQEMCKDEGYILSSVTLRVNEKAEAEWVVHGYQRGHVTDNMHTVKSPVLEDAFREFQRRLGWTRNTQMKLIKAPPKDESAPTLEPEPPLSPAPAQPDLDDEIPF
jgi:hypothetical protein